MMEFTWKGYIIGKGKPTFRNAWIISVSSFPVFLSFYCSLFIPVSLSFIWAPLLVFHTRSLGKSLLCERNQGLSCLWNSLNLSSLMRQFCFSLLFSPQILPPLSLSLWQQWRIIVGATKCIPKSELPEEPEENSVTSNRLWTHPSDLTIALSASTPLYPPGRIIHVVHNHPAEQCW